MDKLVHFAKVFGIVWAVITGLWVVAFFRGADFSVAWLGHSRPPMWFFQLLLWLWPVVPALLIAGLWELLRVVRMRTVR